MKMTKLFVPGKWYAEFDAKGICTGIVCDKSYRDLLGYEAETQKPRACEDWMSEIHPEDAERVIAHWGDVCGKHRKVRTLTLNIEE